MRQLFIGLFLVLVICVNHSKGQNLVPNPSFEDTVYCPISINQVDACLNWFSAGSSATTPDYFNTCSITPGISPPLTFAGDQNPVMGNAYTHVATFTTFPSPGGGREFISTELNNPLIIGQPYYISMYVNLPGRSGSAIATNNLGMLFTTYAFSQSFPAQIINFAHYSSDSLLSDTVNWVHLKGSFIPDSNYTYLTIGNFFDNVSTDTLSLIANAVTGSYLIDNVCVSNDSAICFLASGINEVNMIFSIFPNPISEKLVIHFTNTNPVDIIIYDALGRQVLKQKLDALNVSSLEINCSNFQNGLYILKCNSNSRKILINH